MDAKVLLPAKILVAVLLACLAVTAKCEGGSLLERAAGGLRRRLPDDGEEKIDGGDRLRIVLCFKHSNNACGPELLRCYCCLTLPGCPCYAEQQECWNVCPVPPTHAATSPSGLGAGGRVIGKCTV